MPHNYEQALLRALADTNDLLALLIKVQLYSVDNPVVYADFRANLARIQERHNAPILYDNLPVSGARN